MLELKKHNETSIGLIGHVIVDYPDPKTARQAIDVMVEAGVALIELQIPFSEPIADGPLFTYANHKALENGVTVADCFKFMEEASKKHSIPFVFMTYGNVLVKMGFEHFVKKAKQAGSKGMIVPDLPVESVEELLKICQEQDFCWAQVIPPNISEERLKLLAKASQGFIYAVARSGVTGAQTKFGEELQAFIKKIRQYSDLSVAVGFGVSSDSDINYLKSIVDYAIVGSHALRVLEKEGLQGLKLFWQKLKLAG